MKFYISHYGSMMNIHRWQTGQHCQYSRQDSTVSMADRTALSVYQLTTGWMVQGSNLGECKIFCTRLPSPKANPASCTMSTASPSWRHSGQVSVLTTNVLLVLKLVSVCMCVCGAIPPPPPVSSRHVIVWHIHKCIHTHFVCRDLKTCVVQINQVRMARTITNFRKLDISLVSRIMSMLNFTIHLNL